MDILAIARWNVEKGLTCKAGHVDIPAHDGEIVTLFGYRLTDEAAASVGIPIIYARSSDEACSVYALMLTAIEAASGEAAHGGKS